MKRIVTILGDFYHDAELIRRAFDQALNPLVQAADYEIVHLDELGLTEELSKHPDVIVLFKEDRLNPRDEHVNLWMTPEIANLISEYVRNGGGWLAWHSGLASYNEDGEYVRMLRGYFQMHPKEHQLVQYTTSNSGGVLEEQLTLEVLDEQYFVHCDQAQTNVFLRSESVKDGRSIAGWAHQYGEGRVCCLTPAHRAEALQHPVMASLLRQTIHWLCKDR